MEAPFFNKFFKNDIFLSLSFIYSIFFINNIFENNPFRFFIYSLIPPFIFIIPILLFPKIAFIYLLMLFFLLCVPYLVNICHIFIFEKKLDIFSMETTFDSNLYEAIEFIKNFVDFKILLFLTCFIIFYCLLLANIKNKRECPKKFFICVCFISGFCSVVYSYYFVQNGFSNKIKFLPFEMVSQYKQYQIEKIEILKIQKERQIGHFKNIRSTLDKNEDEIYVVVIGESANKIHQSLYGYYRNTNKNLLKIKDKLYVFKNVRSPHSHTLASLRKVLTFAYDDKVDLYYKKGSIINYFNDAGFKTFWISNQYFSGKTDNIVGIIGNEATSVEFINGPSGDNNYVYYDEKIIPYYEKALNDKAKRKAIFIHLMGSHEKYSNRIPKKFLYFSKKPFDKTSVFSKKAQEKINAYDDSIMYTDYIINEMIEKLSKKNAVSYLLYFSDHGEDVYDTRIDKIF